MSVDFSTTRCSVISVAHSEIFESSRRATGVKKSPIINLRVLRSLCNCIKLKLTRSLSLAIVLYGEGLSEFILR